MAGEPAGMLESHAAENERDAVGERVRVDAETDPQVAHPSGTWRASRCSNTVIVA